MISREDIIKRLKAAARTGRLEGMSRFGISIRGRLGVSLPDLRKIARDIGRDHGLAQELWDTGIPEARILASLVDVAGEVTGEQMDAWVRAFDSWDVCDQVCMNLFRRAVPARRKIFRWARQEGEFVKRAAFTLMACLAVHQKTAGDGEFTNFLPVIKSAASDDRNYVKKAVSWALRSIGKRNPELNRRACLTAREIRESRSPAARWIAADVLRELENQKVRQRIRKKAREKENGT